MRSVAVAVDGIPRPRWAARLRRFCTVALRRAGYDAWDLSILLCDDHRMRDLNSRYRGMDQPTDVLSFGEARVGHSPLRRQESPGTGAPPGSAGARPIRGDIAISLDTLRRNAAAYGVSDDEELKRLLVHGLLHLAGMDHGRGKGRGMLARQERLLSELRADRVMEPRADRKDARA